MDKLTGLFKHVTVIIELKARFDEERNIEGAKKLEQAGAQVIYGVKGLKTQKKNISCTVNFKRKFSKKNCLVLHSYE